MPLNLSTRDLLFMLGIPAVSDLISSGIASRGVRKATDAQLESNRDAQRISERANRDSLNVLDQLDRRQSERMRPYTDTGAAAQQTMASLMGLSYTPRQEADIKIPGDTGNAPSFQAPGATGSTGNSGEGGIGRTALGIGTAAAPFVMSALKGGTAAPYATASADAVNALSGMTGAAPVKAGSGFLGKMGSLGKFAMNPAVAIPAAAAIGTAAWLKSQAHWEANTAVKDFENPFHFEFLKPLTEAHASGQLSSEQAVNALDQNWNLYQQEVMKWAGNSSDKKKVAQQSIQNLSGLVQKIRSDAAQPSANAGQDQRTPPAPVLSSRDRLMSAADRYRVRA